MIFYYSATGNTRYAAKELARLTGQSAVDILKIEGEALSPDAEEVGFLFPIYCWGIPPVMMKFIQSVAPSLRPEQYVWSLCTCGDEAGIAMRLFSKAMEKERGRGADAMFSLIMPNTYVMLPGFDVDSPEVENRKLEEAPERLRLIAETLGKREKGVFDVHEGSMPALRTRLLFPLFEKWGVFPKKWHATDACIGCGKCAAICPARNITMHETAEASGAKSRPLWGSRCFSCCGCFHVCPVHAANYGSITLHKHQLGTLHPEK